MLAMYLQSTDDHDGVSTNARSKDNSLLKRVSQAWNVLGRAIRSAFALGLHTLHPCVRRDDLLSLEMASRT